MSQLDYYRQDPLKDLPHRGGLVGWGVTLIVMGALAGLMVAFTLMAAIAAMTGILPGVARGGQNPLIMLSGAVVYLIAAIALIWIGIGSRQGRRWVRPLMIAGSSLMIVWGLAAIVPMVSGIVSLSRHPVVTPATPGLPPYFQLMVVACSGCFVVLLMEVLPLILLWFYGRASVKVTLEMLDPIPRWTDRCPIPVLTWCFACAVQSLGLWFAITKGIFPFFNTILVGLPAVLATGTLALMLLGGAVLCFHTKPIGWVVTFVACLILTGSFLTFGILGDTHRYIDLLLGTIPQASRQMAEQMGSNTWLGPLILYGSELLYSLWLLKWFTGRLNHEEQPANEQSNTP